MKKGPSQFFVPFAAFVVEKRSPERRSRERLCLQSFGPPPANGASGNHRGRRELIVSDLIAPVLPYGFTTKFTKFTKGFGWLRDAFRLTGRA